MSLSGITESVERLIQPEGKGNKSELPELETVIREQSQVISTLQSQNQELLSELTKAQGHIESLTQRAAKVNETEIRNMELLRKAEEAKAMSDKDRRAAAIDRSEAEKARAEARRALQIAEYEGKIKAAAVKQAENAKSDAIYTKDRYRVVFVGFSIFAVALALLTAYDKRYVLPECGAWFVRCWQGIMAICQWCAVAFGSIVSNMNTEWGLHISWCYVITIAVSVLIMFCIGFFMAWMLKRIAGLFNHIGGNYTDSTFKAVLSIASAVSLFYACLFLYEPIKAALPLNIFSVWLISSLVICLALNFPEVCQGFKDWRENGMQ